MAGLDMTTFAAALKTLYGPEAVENMVYKNNPFFAMVPKDEGFTGDSKKIPIKFGNPQNRSADFTTANAGTTSSKLSAFFITRVKDYSKAVIDSETMLASQGDKGAFMSALTTEMDSAIDSLGRSIAIALYGTGSGTVGQCNASVTGTSLVLKNANDVTNFEIGQVLVFAAAETSGSLKSGSVTVSAVNRDSGTLTVSALSGIDGGTGVAANDYIFNSGDRNAKLSGLKAWLPVSAPSATAFFGVDRSVDPTRLGGVRVANPGGATIEEVLQLAATRLWREGGAPDKVFMNPADYYNLQIALGSKVQIIDTKVNNQIGFPGFQIQGPKGVMTVVADPNCPSGTAFMLQMDTWKLHSLKKAPFVQDLDGNKMLRASASDSLEIRVAAYLQLACYAPGKNAIITL